MGDASQATSIKPTGMQAYRAPSLLQPHRARDAIADAHAGKIPPLIGYFTGFASVQVARFIAQLGWDWVWIDWEHNAMNVETMTSMVHEVQYISEGKSIAFVRVPGHDHAMIGNALDAGASIVVPQVETVEQAQHICSATKFGKIHNGNRSAPPARWVHPNAKARLDPSVSLHQNLNNQAALIIQIESVAGINNLDSILEACGKWIDCVWIGSFDCRVSMGLDGFAGGEPEWLEVLGKYNDVLKKWDMPSGGLVLGGPEARAGLGIGKCFMGVEFDMMALMQSSMKTFGELREEFPFVKKL